MATERQIAANRANATRSTGPTSEAGKARSRLNSTKHGLAGASAAVEAGISPEFADRRARWAPEYQPEGEAGEWALDQVVAASLRIERCGRSLEKLATLDRQRARVAWGQDREVEAATIAGRLSKDPVLGTRQLETTIAGACLLLDAWFALARTLEAGRDWSEAEASRALDLLGIALDARSGRTLIDPPDEPEPESGPGPVAFRSSVVAEEVARLEALRDEALAPIEAMERQLAMDGDLALLSKPAKLLLRYERDAWRRYRESRKVLQKPVPAPASSPLPTPAVPAVVPPTLAPIQLGERAGVVERNEAKLEAIFGQDRRTLLAQAANVLAKFTGHDGPLDLDGDLDWVDEVERKRDAIMAERSQFGDATAAGLATNGLAMSDRK